MSGLRRTEELYNLKFRKVSSQRTDGSFPADTSVLSIIDDRGNAEWTRDLSVASLTLDISGTLTYDGSTLLLNGNPVVPAADPMTDISGIFFGFNVMPDTTIGQAETFSYDFTVPTTGHYLVFLKYTFANPGIAYVPIAGNTLATILGQNDLPTWVTFATDSITNASEYYSATGGILSIWPIQRSVILQARLVAGTNYAIRVLSSGNKSFTITEAKYLRISA